MGVPRLCLFSDCYVHSCRMRTYEFLFVENSGVGDFQDVMCFSCVVFIGAGFSCLPYEFPPCIIYLDVSINSAVA